MASEYRQLRIKGDLIAQFELDAAVHAQHTNDYLNAGIFSSIPKPGPAPTPPRLHTKNIVSDEQFAGGESVEQVLAHAEGLIPLDALP